MLRLLSTKVTVQRQLFEREIRTSLAKLERLAALLPEQDAKKDRANKDLNSLNEQLGTIMMSEEVQTEALDLQAKKLMTVCRSKYYMLKVNYPQLAELIDSEFDQTQLDREDEETKEQVATPRVSVKPLADQAELLGEDSMEAREAQ